MQPLDINERDQRPDEVRLSDLEPLFICRACGIRGADVRPNFDWHVEEKPPLHRRRGLRAIE